jgi:hypothetical protein
MTTSIHTKMSLTAIALTLAACGGGGGSGDTPAVGNTPPPIGNSAPTIASLPKSQTLAQDASSEPIAFSVADPESTPTELKITTASSNPALIPADAIQVLGNDGTRSVLLTPMEGAAGQATITVTATDPAGLSSQQSMEVVVASSERSFTEMVNTAFAKPDDVGAEETIGYNWVNDPVDDDTAFDHLKE